MTPGDPRDGTMEPGDDSVTEVSAEVLDELGRLFGDDTPRVADEPTGGPTDVVQVVEDADVAEDVVVVDGAVVDDVVVIDDAGAAHGGTPADGGVTVIGGDDSPMGTVLPFSAPVPRSPAALGDPLIVIEDEPDVVDPATDVDPRFEERRRVWARRDRLRRVRWVKIAGLLVALVVMVSVVLASPLFAIRSFTIEGNVYISPASVDEARRILKGTSIFTADTARARAVLLRDPWVSDVRITTRFPSGVVVEVSERMPVVWYVGTDNKARIIDARGVVIDVLDGFPTKYLQVKGTGSPVEAGANADDAYRAAAQLVLALPDEIRPKVAALDLSPAGELSMVLKGDTLVRFGTPVDLQNKLVAVVVLLRRQDPKTIAVIDVSAGDPTVLGR
ncbi:MAG: cell division protein FtsQ/DivIB [Ilumatobacteraceae bacterium]